jgi:hypothetical protein
MGEAPVLLVPCVQERAMPARGTLPLSLDAMYERELAYERRIRGASIYPAVQNILLACRAFGLGTLITLPAGGPPECEPCKQSAMSPSPVHGGIGMTKRRLHPDFAIAHLDRADR